MGFLLKKNNKSNTFFRNTVYLKIPLPLPLTNICNNHIFRFSLSSAKHTNHKKHEKLKQVPLQTKQHENYSAQTVMFTFLKSLVDVTVLGLFPYFSFIFLCFYPIDILQQIYSFICSFAFPHLQISCIAFAPQSQGFQVTMMIKGNFH